MLRTSFSRRQYWNKYLTNPNQGHSGWASAFPPPTSKDTASAQSPQFFPEHLNTQAPESPVAENTSRDQSQGVAQLKAEDEPSPLRKALIFRNMLLDRIASENLYDVVRKNPTMYFSKAPHIDPNEGFKRADMLKKLQSHNFDLGKLTTSELKKAYKLELIDVEDFLWNNVEASDSPEKDSTQAESLHETEELPWEILAMRSEMQAMLRGEPTLDEAESILKGKHITDPREFTQEDLQRIKEWDRGFHKRELLDCVLPSQNKILETDDKVADSFKILQETKQTVLEDAEYQQSIAEVQHESQVLWENASAKKIAKPWKASAADKFPFYDDPSSRVPKYAAFNIAPIKEPEGQAGVSRKKSHYTHYRVLKGRELRNSSKHSLTKKFS